MWVSVYSSIHSNTNITFCCLFMRMIMKNYLHNKICTYHYCAAQIPIYISFGMMHSGFQEQSFLPCMVMTVKYEGEKKQVRILCKKHENSTNLNIRLL